MPSCRGWWLVVGVCGVASWLWSADPPAKQTVESQFTATILPLLKQHCWSCHDETKQEGKLKLSQVTTLAEVTKHHGLWEIILERLKANEMPPAESSKPLSDRDRTTIVSWITTWREAEARKNAGDPGIVLARRLSNAEYDNTIRDLTGIDMRPTREFPVDPANEAGFDNSGESLTMSPALVRKYLDAAKLVADHLVLKPQGFVFAPHPVVTDTDRDKYCVHQIVRFYQRHEVDYADYFFAAWQYQHRTALGRPDASLEDFVKAADDSDSQTATDRTRADRTMRSLSTRYLTRFWQAISTDDTLGPLAEIQAEWRKLPTDVTKVDEARRQCQTLRDLVLKLRKELDSKVEKLHIKGASDGSQPLVLWWNREIASRRMSYRGDGKEPDLDAARERFCRVFPNTFAVTSRGHYADQNLGAQVRLLTAGFHLMQGYFRDDTPLCELVLDDNERAELDAMWQELNFITLVPIRQYKDFLFFERAEPPRFAGGPEFDFARPENKDVTSSEKLERMRDAYLAKAQKSDASDVALEAIKTYFANIAADVRWIEKTRLAAEPSHLQTLTNFASRAYRRPLTDSERDELLAFYRKLRDRDGLTHDEALRDSVISILMSPHFSYRVLETPLSKSPDRNNAASSLIQPLTGESLASRLSYFLWSSLPDEALLAAARRGELRQPATLKAQVRRMVRDDRFRGLASEFAGNWLGFRRFEEHHSVDRERFPTFSNELRAAMFEEPIRFFVDVARHDRSVLDFVVADHTFVNPVLAKHYGIEWMASASSGQSSSNTDDWWRVDNARRFGRGGLLSMGVFLTQNSPGLRTSPVKRGYWVVRRLLGEHIPAPPPEVPELPKDEAALGELTLPQLLARHRDHRACAGCHQRFDSIGLSFEGYGPVGERRRVDLGGRPVQETATFPNGQQGTGVEDLRRYLIEHRKAEFIDQLCRKLFVYALGRGELLSDRLTIEQIKTDLAANEFRFVTLVESIVSSPQFLNARHD